MARKKQIIGKDGELKTVVRRTRSRENRIEQHMHGRSDYTRNDSDRLKYGVYAGVIVLVIGLLLLVFWLVMK